MDGAARGAIRIGLATAAWAAVHSLLASRPAKGRAGRALGTRARNGVYRAGYNAIAVVTFALLVGYVRRQPGRTLYHAGGPAALLMRLGQAGAAFGAAWGVLQVGLGGMSGLPNLLAWLAGARHVSPEPEGQTPPPNRGAGGPFAHTRQALNFLLLPLLWLNPRMTTRLAAFNIVSTAYLYLGSLHSERRLRRAYGPAYDEAYRRRGVPFFLPRLGNRFPSARPAASSGTATARCGRSIAAPARHPPHDFIIDAAETPVE